MRRARRVTYRSKTGGNVTLRNLFESRGLDPLSAAALCGFCTFNRQRGRYEWQNLTRILEGRIRVTTHSLDAIANGLQLTEQEKENLRIELDSAGFYCRIPNRSPKRLVQARTEVPKPVATARRWQPMTKEAAWHLRQLGRPLGRI